jgi:transcriptional regulator with XRE-family HTH domain
VRHADARLSRHAELGAFLTSRRTRLLPESCGLPHFRRRRRTPGLRREEVSALAGISTVYYTWIEQGRMFDLSIEVLDAIAGALQLNDIEAAHLFTLAGKLTTRPPLTTDGVAAWRRAIIDFVRQFEDGPALVLSPWLDINETNRAAQETFGIDAGTNFAEAIFCNDGSVTYRDTDTLAGALVALLRRNHAQDIENAQFNNIISGLCARSNAFKVLWDGHVVDNPPLFEVEIERTALKKARFCGVIVSDPIAARQFALLMNRCEGKDHLYNVNGTPSSMSIRTTTQDLLKNGVANGVLLPGSPRVRGSRSRS